MKLVVPHYFQKTDYHCGPASLQMIFDYFGVYKSQGKIGKQADTEPKRGISHTNMIRIAQEAGFFVM